MSSKAKMFTVPGTVLDQKSLAYQQMMTVLQEDALNQMRAINPDFDAYVKKTEQEAKDQQMAGEFAASEGRTSTEATAATVAPGAAGETTEATAATVAPGAAGEKKEEDQNSTTTKTSTDGTTPAAVSCHNFKTLRDWPAGLLPYSDYITSGLTFKLTDHSTMCCPDDPFAHWFKTLDC